MTLFQKYVEVFTDWDVDAFRGLHHEDFMFVRETDLLNLDEHIEIIDKLVRDGQMNWHKRQSFWYQSWFKLSESLAHLVNYTMLRACCDASVALRMSFV